MQRRWLPMLVIAMLIEIGGIYMMGRWIGGLGAFALLIATVVLGLWLIKTEGRRVWQQAQQQMQAGQVPGHTLLEGLCVLAGGILLIVPGFISDIIGITMIVPFTRPVYRLIMYRWLERKVRNGSFSIYPGNRG